MRKKSGLDKLIDLVMKMLVLAASTLFMKLDSEGYLSIAILVGTLIVVLYIRWKEIKQACTEVKNRIKT